MSRNFRSPCTMTTNKPPKPVALVLVEDAGMLLKQEAPFSRPFSGLGLSKSEGFCRCLKRIVAARTHVEKQELRYRGDSSLISNYGGESLCLSALEFGVLFSRFKASRPSWSNHPTASPTLQSLLLHPHQPLAITPNPSNGHYSPLLLLLISSFSSFTQPQYAN